MTRDSSSPPSPAGGQATARDFLAVVFRRKWIIIGLFAVSTATVLTISVTTPALYLSSGRVLVKRGEQTSVFQADRRIYDDWEHDLGSEMQLVRNEPVLERARERLRGKAGPDGQPLRIRPGGVEVEVMGKSNVLAIGYRDGNPEVAHLICDALINAYLDYRQENTNLPYPQRFFDQELARVEAELDHYSRLRRQFTSDEQLVDINVQKANGLNRLSGLLQRRSDLNEQLVGARAHIEIIRALLTQDDPDVSALGVPYDFSAMIDLKGRILALRARLADLHQHYRDDAPEVATAESTLSSLRGMLMREVEAGLAAREADAQVLEVRMKTLDDEVGRLRAELELLPDQEVTLAEIDRRAALLRTRYASLVNSSDQARVTQNTSSEVSVLLLSPAGPGVRSNTRDVVRLALAPAFSIVVGIGLAFFLDGLDITVRTPSQAESATELPVLATVPERRRRASAS